MASTLSFPSPTRRWHTKAQPATLPSRPELSAKGKSIIVTGGGTGIGGETARYFAEAGASRIALLGRREAPLLENKTFIENNFPRVEVFTIPTDVSKQSDVNAAFAHFVGNGTIDVLVHSAAILGPKEPVASADGEAYLGAIQHNISGAFWVAQAFLRHAAPNAVAVIINSMLAYFSFNDEVSSYSVSKLAMFRLWDTVGLANPNLSVFHTHPGVIQTEMSKQPGGRDSTKEAQAAVPADDVSLPASFNVWLASPEARFLKGKFLFCNWDVEELKAQAKELEEGTKLSIGLMGWPFDHAV